MPAYLPRHREAVLVSGAAEIAGGVGVLVPATRAARALVADRAARRRVPGERAHGARLRSDYRESRRGRCGRGCRSRSCSAGRSGGRPPRRSVTACYPEDRMVGVVRQLLPVRLDGLPRLRGRLDDRRAGLRHLGRGKRCRPPRSEVRSPASARCARRTRRASRRCIATPRARPGSPDAAPRRSSGAAPRLDRPTDPEPLRDRVKTCLPSAAQVRQLGDANGHVRPPLRRPAPGTTATASRHLPRLLQHLAARLRDLAAIVTCGRRHAARAARDHLAPAVTLTRHLPASVAGRQLHAVAQHGLDLLPARGAGLRRAAAGRPAAASRRRPAAEPATAALAFRIPAPYTSSGPRRRRRSRSRGSGRSPPCRAARARRAAPPRPPRAASPARCRRASVYLPSL